MSLPDQQALSSETHSVRHGRDCPERGCSLASPITFHSSSHAPQSESDRHHSNGAAYGGVEEDVAVGDDSDDSYDSDATLDLDEATLSPLLRNTPPLQRMSRDYERVVLRSLSQGRLVTYSCVCSRGECVLNVESKGDGSEDSSEVLERSSDDEWSAEGEMDGSFRPSRRRKYIFPMWRLFSGMKQLEDTSQFIDDSKHAQSSDGFGKVDASLN